MNSLLEELHLPDCVEEGPLGRYIGAFAEQLLSEGYARQSRCVQIRLIGGFSRWLHQKAVAACQVGDQHTVEYLRYRRRCGYRRGLGDAAALARLVNLLRHQGVIAERPVCSATTPSELLAEEYDRYLQTERALSLSTRINYLPFVREFLIRHFGKGRVALSRLRAADVFAFVCSQAPKLKSKRVSLMTTALRSFLRFSRHRGDITVDLAACVPAVASWSLSTLPRSLPRAHVQQVLRHCRRRTTAVGRRDYAMLLLLARLGLRAGEVAGLTLEDMDWDRGIITVQGKGGRSSELPLPVDVGKAIVAYIEHGRPQASRFRRIFFRAHAPIAPLEYTAVRDIVKRALARAGIDAPRKGAHQFRHALATEMLRRGASLSEIGELLRHQSPDTTRIYAKVDLVALRTLALPWPGGVR